MLYLNEICYSAGLVPSYDYIVKYILSDKRLVGELRKQAAVIGLQLLGAGKIKLVLLIPCKQGELRH